MLDQDLQKQYEEFEEYGDVQSSDWYREISRNSEILITMKSRANSGDYKDYQTINNDFKKLLNTDDDFLDHFLFKRQNGCGSIGQQSITHNRREELWKKVNENATDLINILKAKSSVEAFENIRNFIGENKWTVIHRFARILFPEQMIAVDSPGKFERLEAELYSRFGIELNGDNYYDKELDLSFNIKSRDPIIRQIFFWEKLNEWKKEATIELPPKLAKLIQDKIKSDQGYWWFKYYEDEWNFIEIGQLYSLPLTTTGNSFNISDLMIVHYNKGNLVEGVFQVEIILEDSIECRYLHEFRNKPTIDDLVDNVSLNDSKFFDLIMQNTAPLSKEQFEEIIKLTELDVGKFEENHRSKDNIPFHLDQVEEVDRLNREPVAKSITNLLNRQIFSSPLRKAFYKRWGLQFLNWLSNDWKENKIVNWIRAKNDEVKKERKSRHAFMIHLQGAWGDGKSTFLNLLRKNLSTGQNKWIVVDFNAWQHQHITPPWWSFLDQVYKQSIAKMSIHKRVMFFLYENYRRIVNLKFIYRISVLIVFTTLLYFSYESIPQVITFFNNSENTVPSDGYNLLQFGKILGAIAGFVGVIYSFTQFLIRPLFLKSPESAKSFTERVSDPMVKVKKHFESIVNNIEVSGYRLAVFIDDLDRCNTSFTVQLLEGIQTLYKDRKVLYIVAGDKNWICNCFECHYEKFNNVVNEPAQKLGYLFLEKAFQLSIRLPHISEKTKQDYWNYILFPNGSNSNNIDKSEIERTEEESLKLKQEFKTKYKKEDYAKPEQYEEIGAELGLSDTEVTDMALETLNEDQEDIKHVLQNHYNLIESNPRSIKRLANQYNVYRDTLIAERKSFNSDKLFRWLVLQNVYPLYVELVEKKLEIINEGDLPKELVELRSNDHWERLVNDPDNLRGGELNMDDINMFVGYQMEGKA